ncbi:hypothetical protein HK097_000815 [Rhizophlyctis rosea]|uniref:Uncharacterized protein n=1 Tax=Rhizophlyctis rosea TaxID=64517 RepID=A0AAD5X167_9FUNG|nr:hypothetical protein HK097_000815 [Rhizophlyctis rosea]
MRAFTITFTLLAAIAGTLAGGVSWTEPYAGISYATGSTVDIKWIWLPNGSGISAAGSESIDIVLVDTRAGQDSGVPVGGSLGKATLESGTAKVNIPADIVAGPSFTFRCQIGSTANFIYTPNFALTAGAGGPAAPSSNSTISPSAAPAAPGTAAPGTPAAAAPSAPAAVTLTTTAARTTATPTTAVSQTGGSSTLSVASVASLLAVVGALMAVMA